MEKNGQQNNAESLIKQFKEIEADTNLPFDERNSKLGAIADRLNNLTINCYNNTAVHYGSLRSAMGTFDWELWDIFLGNVDKAFKTRNGLKVLDIGAAVGRDMQIGQERGLDMYGIEKPDGFLKILDDLHSSGQIKNKVKKCDMRELDYPESFFDVVRHVATLCICR